MKVAAKAVVGRAAAAAEKKLRDCTKLPTTEGRKYAIIEPRLNTEPE